MVVLMSRPCVICDNAYGTRYVCQACQADPANDGWREARNETEDEDLDSVIVANRLADIIGVPIRNEKPIVIQTLVLLHAGSLSLREIAVRVGKSHSWVDYIYRTRVAGTSKTSAWGRKKLLFMNTGRYRE